MIDSQYSWSRRQFLRAAAAVAGGALQQAASPFAQVRTQADWARLRARILTNMQLVMGQLPPPRKEPVEIVRERTEELPACTRIKLKYLSEPGDYVPAYLLVPRWRRRPAPAVLCLHQTINIGKDEPAGLGGSANLHYAQELAGRGYVTLAPDYPYLGENRFDPYEHGYVSCTMKGIVNHRRAVDVLQALPEVDKERIGCVGHSLGGHNALFVAAFDQRIKALVTSCGFTSFRKYYGGDLTGWAGQRYMPRIAEKYGKDPARVPFDFPAVLVALAPRPLFINAPERDANFEVSGVEDCVNAALPIYERLFKAPERLVALYPDIGHDFPTDVRQEAWEFLGKWLG